MRGLDWTHHVRDLPAEGLSATREANAEQRIELANQLDIPSIELLVVKYRIKSVAGGRFELAGDLDAHVVQACVVSLEPVEARVTGPLLVLLHPAGDGPSLDDDESADDDLDAPDTEPIENGVIDVGRIVYEELASRLDPYPRRRDVSFEWTDSRDDESADHPFAKLGRLRGDEKS